MDPSKFPKVSDRIIYLIFTDIQNENFVLYNQAQFVNGTTYKKNTILHSLVIMNNLSK